MPHAAHRAPSTEYRPRQPEELLLHRIVRDHLETFVAREVERGGSLPRFVDRELRKFVACGAPGLGFVRVRCTDCGYDRAVPFSCKGRGFCPGCGGRRMAETAARLVDRVLPRVPIRQWVLSLPRPLRYRLAYNADLCSAVLGVFLRAVFGWLRRRAKGVGVANGQPGAVTQIQRFGSAINLNLHLHSLVLDGVYTEADGRARYRPLPPPTQRDIDKLCAIIARRVRRLLVRRGLADESAADPLAEQEPLLAGVCSASIQSPPAIEPARPSSAWATRLARTSRPHGRHRFARRSAGSTCRPPSSCRPATAGASSTWFATSRAHPSRPSAYRSSPTVAWPMS